MLQTIEDTKTSERELGAIFGAALQPAFIFGNETNIKESLHCQQSLSKGK